MNETIECLLERQEYEEIITITAYVSVGIFVCCTLCVVKFVCCR